MKVREMIDWMLDYCEMDYEIVVAEGKSDDFDEYNTKTSDLECMMTTDKNGVCIFKENDYE